MSVAPMRLALLVGQFCPAGSDAQFAVTQLGSELAQRGHDVTFLTAIAHGHPPDRCRLIAQLPSLHRYRRAAVRDPWAFAAWACRQLDQGLFDASFSVDAQLPAAVVEPRFRLLGQQLAQQADPRESPATRIRAGIQRYTQSRQLAWQREALVHPRVKRIVAVSELVAQQIQQQMPTVANRLVRLADATAVKPTDAGLRQRLRAALTTPADSRVILWSPIGSATGARRLALEAFARLRQSARPVVLWVLGPVRFADHRLAVRLGIREQVRFLGSTQRLELACLAADLTLHLPEFAAASRLVLTSLAMGTAVVTTPRDGAGEQIKPSNGQVIAWPSRPDTLMQALDHWTRPAHQATGQPNQAAANLRYTQRIEQIEGLLKQVI